jgi:hypothetical protein
MSGLIALYLNNVIFIQIYKTKNDISTGKQVMQKPFRTFVLPASFIEGETEIAVPYIQLIIPV